MRKDFIISVKAQIDFRIQVFSCSQSHNFVLLKFQLYPDVFGNPIKNLFSANQTLALKVLEVMGYALELEVC